MLNIIVMYTNKQKLKNTHKTTTMSRLSLYKLFSIIQATN